MARILVVDDDVKVRRTVRALLERAGHAVVLAERGHDGAAAIEAFAFDLAIVDIFMPGMNGLETIRAFRQSAPTLPIIVISGYVFRDARGPAPDFFRMAVDLGAAACLRKPVKPTALLRAVEECSRAARRVA
ncbi:MAG TPA: response regulator [Xanthobacteraceae bacterium]|nr:response regulator [Xanthobacteraceae bacterium]